MNIVVLRETQAGEARVALMPESVKKLVALKAQVHVESGAGLSAARDDDDFREAGAEVSNDRRSAVGIRRRFGCRESSSRRRLCTTAAKAPLSLAFSGHSMNLPLWPQRSIVASRLSRWNWFLESRARRRWTRFRRWQLSRVTKQC